MRLVYAHDNSALVGLAKSMLENSGITTMIKNEFSSAGFPPYNQNQELWVVDENDYGTALEVLENLEEEDGADKS